ncbi:hypothetical protein CDIK_4188 [Cucumispora dikerogammari]|nr:hypothetical protein CDIK_4188 [Cucumispora dikerogammari]
MLSFYIIFLNTTYQQEETPAKRQRLTRTNPTFEEKNPRFKPRVFRHGQGSFKYVETDKKCKLTFIFKLPMYRKYKGDVSSKLELIQYGINRWGWGRTALIDEKTIIIDEKLCNGKEISIERTQEIKEKQQQQHQYFTMIITFNEEDDTLKFPASIRKNMSFFINLLKGDKSDILTKIFSFRFTITIIEKYIGAIIFEYTMFETDKFVFNQAASTSVPVFNENFNNELSLIRIPVGSSLIKMPNELSFRKNQRKRRKIEYKK